MKKYEFNYESLFDLRDKLYSVRGLYFKENVDIEDFNKENLYQFINQIKIILDSPKISEIEDHRSYENINIFKEETNKKINDIFHDKDLKFMGHGGLAKEIIETEFISDYGDLGSSFIDLSCENESLSKLKKWPHKSCTKIAILALNIHEYNPIFKKIGQKEPENPYSHNVYSISNDYFVGYYDSEKDEFYLNPNFKKRHDYDPDCEEYEDEQLKQMITPINSAEIIKDYYYNLSLICNIMMFSSDRAILDEVGYKNVCKDILDKVNKLKKFKKK